jgi:hypothetical protein
MRLVVPLVLAAATYCGCRPIAAPYHAVQLITLDPPRPPPPTIYYKRPGLRPAAAVEQTPEPPRARPAVVSIVGRVKTGAGVPLPGIVMRIGGARDATTITDANGSFQFQVPPGSYFLAPPRDAAPGIEFSPEIMALAPLDADAIQDFTCAGPCLAGPAVTPAKELVITDPTVVGDARASSAAAGSPWSFRFLVEQMTPAGVDPADFVGAWLGQMDLTDHHVNGFPVDKRHTSALRALWPTIVGNRLDLSRAPFRLLAITNRVDLHAAGNGEGRLVYGVVDSNGVGRPMTVIFEFELPSRDMRTGAQLTRRDWAARFHALGSLPFGAQYNAALQDVTDLFTRRNTNPARPGGSSILQVRSNEVLMGGPWQLREFRLGTDGGPLALWLFATAQTPADGAAVAGTPENRALIGYLDASRAAIYGGFASVPAGLLGGQATENFSWTFKTPVDAEARHAFAGQTCNGCHSSEIGGLQRDGFYHVSPIAEPGSDGSGRLSSFVREQEFPRRTLFMQSLLTCSPPACPAGGEPGVN